MKNIQIRKFSIESQYISRFNGNLIRIDNIFRIICDLTQGICFLCSILIYVIKYSITAAHIMSFDVEFHLYEIDLKMEIQMANFENLFGEIKKS